ncbi:MAG TPA: SAM-dependent methyltransferase [Pseudonocardiaceae bacterium]|nr:SAM-dependent methyltransferase [Pseudonocardiaceae bacterium]
MADVAAQVPGIDTSTPSIARVYDYLLGGKDNFACDRAVATQLAGAVPDLTLMAQQNRAFLGRVVRFLADQGIRQFVDIGTGLPTQNNVHQVAQSVVPDAHVVYVDNDPIVLAHARALLAENANTIVIEGDLRAPAEILAHPDLVRLIDLDQPVAVLLVGILYFFPAEDRPFEIVETLRDAVAPGSFVALSHVVSDVEPEAIGAAQEIYRGFLHRTGDARRTLAQVSEFFTGLDLVEPGLVPVGDWRADGTDPSPATSMFGGVGRKP